MYGTIRDSVKISGGDLYSIFKNDNVVKENNKNEDKDFIVKRAEVYDVDLGTDVVGSEQAFKRPCLIIQNDVGNEKSSTVIIAVLTSKDKNKKSKMPTHVIIKKDNFNKLKSDSMVLLEQLRTVDKKRLGRKIGKLNDTDMNNVDNALDVSVHNKRKNNFSTDEKREQNEVFDISIARDYADQIKGLTDFINTFDNPMVNPVKRGRDTLINELKKYCDKFNKNINLFYNTVSNKNNNYKGRTAINA